VLHGTFLADALTLLLAAVVVVSGFRFFHISAILGYLIAGVVIGPHALNLLANIENASMLGEFGVVFLLFTLGLKMPLQRLQVLRRYVFGLGLAQVGVTSACIFAAIYLAGISAETAVLVGSALALSSTAVSMQVLTERGEFALRHGRVAFAVLLFQDLAVVILIALVSTLGKEHGSFTYELAVAGVKAFVSLLLITLLGRIVFRPLYRGIAQLSSPELFVAVTLLVVLTTGAITASLGLSMELGAFLAGLLLSETEYRHQVEADIQPFYGLLLGLFFISVGMTIDLSYVVETLPLVLTCLVFLISVKASLFYPLARLFDLPKTACIRVAFILSTGGEFVFVLLRPVIRDGLVSAEIGQLVYAVVGISMALTPFMASMGKFLAHRWMEQEAESSLNAAKAEITDLKNHVIICGFGRVGKLIAKLLTQKMVPYVAIDNDMARVSEGRAKGLPVFYGDARRVHMMRTLGADRARAAVISLDKPRLAVEASLMMRRQFPKMDVCVRMRDNQYEMALHQAGVRVVMPENLEPSLQLASQALQAVGTPDDEIYQVIENFRRSYKQNTLLNTQESPAKEGASKPKPKEAKT
jgi:CPA2 family monovalent cation:H+ antiporter-2